MIEADLYSALKNHVWLSALVSTRIYPMILPQNGTLPAITYQKISGVRVNSLRGSSDLASARFQIDAWSRDYLEAKQVAKQVREAMKTANFKVLVDSDRDFYENDTHFYRVSTDFTVWHDE